VLKSAVAARLHKPKGFWFLIRRVPTAFKSFDHRNPVRISTGIWITDDPRGVGAGVVVARQLKAHDGLRRIRIEPRKLQHTMRFPDQNPAGHRVGPVDHQIEAAANIRLDFRRAHPVSQARWFCERTPHTLDRAWVEAFKPHIEMIVATFKYAEIMRILRVNRS